jgi:ATP-dependent DNA helicase DinG
MKEMNMEKYLGEKGLFSENLPFFEFRSQQLDLAQKIWDRIHSENGGIMAFEAPTGLGKTFAVLVPAILWALENDKKILFLTATIPLQEQLYFKDIPQILHVLDVELKYGLLKGRGNYACLRRAENLYSEGLLSFSDHGDVSDLIRSWVAQTSTGDLSELPLPLNHPSRGMINSVQKKCLGSNCPGRNECFVTRAIQRAKKWDLIVSNYHLYFAYVLGGKNEFPVNPDLIICDEAHRIDESFRSVSSKSVSKEDFENLFSKSNYPFLSGVVDNYGGISEFTELYSQLGSGTGLFFEKIATGVKEGQVYKKLDRDSLDLFLNIKEDYEKIKKILFPLTRSIIDKEDTEDKDSLRFLAWQNELDDLFNDLAFCAVANRYPEWAYWEENNGLHASPTVCSDLIQEVFASSASALIAVSATLTVDNSFAFWIKETGIVPDTKGMYSSPFDLEKQMEIWIADIGLKVIDKGYDNYVARVMETLTENNGGHTLILVSSKRLLEILKKHFRKKERSYNVLVQGELPRTILLDRFRTSESSVLIGTVSFREGVDIPGEKLTQVIIDRIPFPHPKDPVVEARNDYEGRRAFVEVTLPRAKMRLKQASGRLIRKKDDWGRVVILDGRIIERKNWQILQSLPRVKIRKISINDTGVAG